ITIPWVRSFYITSNILYACKVFIKLAPLPGIVFPVLVLFNLICLDFCIYISIFFYQLLFTCLLSECEVLLILIFCFLILKSRKLLDKTKQSGEKRKLQPLRWVKYQQKYWSEFAERQRSASAQSTHGLMQHAYKKPYSVPLKKESRMKQIAL